MCGIAGVFKYASGSAASNAELNAMADAMRLRGPDGSATWVDPQGRLGFAHRRLAILDPTPRSDQPMLTADGRYVIVFNGEIYNFRQLRDQLIAEGHVFRTEGDTEVLLECFRAYGPAMLDRLRGMYAFAIWNLSERTLFLARDPLGIKPLFYSLQDGTLRFASQVKALCASVPQLSPNPAGQVGFLLWGSVPEPHTMYREIRALPAGHWMELATDGEPRMCSFSSVPATLAHGAAHPVEDRQASAEALHQALRESLRAHMVSDVPIALFLSAGLDSATLAALSAEIPELHLNALTLGFDAMRGTPSDETTLAADIAAAYGIPFEAAYVTQQDFASEYERLLEAMDQPTIDGVNVYFVSRLAHQAGYKVALSGLGGDELFAGYGSFRQVPRLARLLGPLRPFPSVGRAFRYLTAGQARRFTSPKYAGLLEYGTTIEDAYLLRRSLFMPWELPEVLDPEIAREGWQALEPIARMRETLAPLSSMHGAIGDRLRVSSLEMTQYMRNQLLRDADWAGMAHSVEVRVPLMDYHLLQQLAPLLASSRPPGKLEMALTPAQRLPEAVLTRTKTGFGVPVREWLIQGNQKTAAQAGRGLRDWALHLLEAFTEA